MPSARKIRVALLCDYMEEQWPSMELVGEMIAEHLRRDQSASVDVTRIVPSFHARARHVPLIGGGSAARRVDLLSNRFADYPRFAARLAAEGRFDLFHVTDHSYAQLVHALPAARTVVTCHDLDTFRCLLAPEREPRPLWFRLMASRILRGFRKAAVVACDSDATRAAVLDAELLPAGRLRTVHLGTHPECTPESDPVADARAVAWLGPRRDEAPELLHVGSNIPRKRVDVLLATFARAKKAIPGARLVKIGGPFEGDLGARARELGVLDACVFVPQLSMRDSRDRAALAAVYRRASLLLQPSDAEGFGLPVVEAMACGIAPLVSDIPVLREIGGGAASYAPVGNVDAWAESTLRLLAERQADAEAWRRRRSAVIERSRVFRWSTHAASLVEIYRELVEGSFAAGSVEAVAGKTST
jgi:glycosyltransferase involved in cell wall biosynthesis